MSAETNKIIAGIKSAAVSVGNSIATAGAAANQGMLIALASTLVAVVIILVIGLLVYFIYLMIVYYYPRPYFIGHSEPLEQFMSGYIPDLITTINKVKEVDPGAIPGSLFGKSKYESKPYIPAVGDYDPENAPFWYLYFALKSNEDYKNKAVVGISTKLVPNCSMAEKISEITFYEKVPETFIQDMKTIDEAITSMQGSLKGVANSKDPAKIHHIRLSFLLTKKHYVENIATMYDFRKSGGLGNMTLLKITMMDYIKYVWIPPKGIVPKTWMTIGTQIEEKKSFISDWLRGPKVNNFVMTLPALIGGVKKEKFTDGGGVGGASEGDGSGESKDSQESREKSVQELASKMGDVIDGLLLPPHTKPGDRVEEFGFLKGLMEIPKILMTFANFFMTLMDVAKALAEAIADPIKAIRIIFGMVIGVVMVILYFIVIMPPFDFLWYIPAAIIVVWLALVKTVWWIFLFVIQAAFFMLLWILDMATGGLFLKIMRCENLPSKWYLQPGWFADNRYLRGFMCNFTCSTRFVPDDDGGWCTRLRRGRPSYCPQQILYNAVNAVVNGTGSGDPVMGKSESDLIYKFVIPSSYYTMDEISKKTKIVEYIRDRTTYFKKCYKFDKKYNAFAITACKFFHPLKESARLLELHEKKEKLLDAATVAALTKKKAEYDAYKDVIDKAMKVCESSFCGQTYMGGDFNKSADAPFCAGIDETKIEQEADDGSEGRSMSQRIIYSSIVLSILMIAFAGLYYYGKDSNFDFMKLWK